MKKLSFYVVFILIVGSSCKNRTFLFTFQPDALKGKDAWVENYPFENYSNRNWGSSEGLIAISWTAGGTPLFVRSFIDFEFDKIPSRMNIDSAKLSLFAHGTIGHGYGHKTLGGSNDCYLQRIIEPWDEDSITWNKQPKTTEWNQVLIPQSDHEFHNFTKIDVTALVRDIYNNPDESFGFMLRLKDESNYRKMMFASSDVDDETKRPKLEIYVSKINKKKR